MAQPDSFDSFIAKCLVMSVNHERPHARVPLRYQTGLVVCCGVVNAILMSGKGIMSLRERHIRITAFTQHDQAVARIALPKILFACGFTHRNGGGHTPG